MTETVTTLDALLSLPDQTIIRSNFGVVYERWNDGMSNVWLSPGRENEFSPGHPVLPVTVLYLPEATS